MPVDPDRDSVSRIYRGRVVKRELGLITTLDGELCSYSVESFPDLQDGDEVQAHCGTSKEGTLFAKKVKLLRRSDDIESPVIASKFGDEAADWLRQFLSDIENEENSKN